MWLRRYQRPSCRHGPGTVAAHAPSRTQSSRARRSCGRRGRARPVASGCGGVGQPAPYVSPRPTGGRSPHWDPRPRRLRPVDDYPRRTPGAGVEWRHAATAVETTVGIVDRRGLDHPSRSPVDGQRRGPRRASTTGSRRPPASTPRTTYGTRGGWGRTRAGHVARRAGRRRGRAGDARRPSTWAGCMYLRVAGLPEAYRPGRGAGACTCADAERPSPSTLRTYRSGVGLVGVDEVRPARWQRAGAVGHQRATRTSGRRDPRAAVASRSGSRSSARRSPARPPDRRWRGHGHHLAGGAASRAVDHRLRRPRRAGHHWPRVDCGSAEDRARAAGAAGGLH